MTIETANRLCEYRKKNNLSQEELAEKLGVSRQAVSKWERSEASPDTDNLIALAKLYGVTLDELIYGKNDKGAEDNFCENEESSDGESNPKNVKIDKNGVFVDDGEGNKVKIDFSGIHAKSSDGDRVNIGLGGIHIHENDDDEDFEIDESGKSRIWVEIPYSILCVIAYLCFGFMNICGGWAASWIVFVTIPVYHSLVDAIYSRRLSEFNYPVFITCIYLYAGMDHNLWHPSWIVFITIPVFYAIASPIDRAFNRRRLKRTAKK